VPIGKGVSRVVIHEPGVRPEHTEGTLEFRQIADAWQRMTGDSIHHGSAVWMAAMTNATGQATEYRKGRVFLAGDAAHDHAPLGAQGLSVGVQDAVNLGWKLASVARGFAPETLLDTYHDERHPIGEQLLRSTQAQSQLYLTGNETEPLRAIMRDLVTYPDTAEHLAALVSGLSIRYPMPAGDHPLLGKRIPPQQKVELPSGETTTVAQLLHPAQPLLITTTPNPALDAIAGTYPDRLTLIAANWTNPDLPTTLFVRPDGYIAWTNPADDPTDTTTLTDALTHWLGTPA
jgi:hypothetical protein